MNRILYICVKPDEEFKLQTKYWVVWICHGPYGASDQLSKYSIYKYHLSTPLGSTLLHGYSLSHVAFFVPLPSNSPGNC